MIRQPRAVKRRMLVPVERLSLADNYCVGRQAQIGMKLRAFTASNAMRRRWSACVMKARVAERMPVARGDDSNVSRDRFLNQRIDQWDDLIAVGDRQRAAPGQKSRCRSMMMSASPGSSRIASLAIVITRHFPDGRRPCGKT